MPRAPTIVLIDSGGHRERVLADRDALVVEHLWLVPPIAQRIKATVPPSFELADLIGEGNFGLIRAATRYRPEAHGGTPFPVFARPRIHGAILDSIRRKKWEENTRAPLPAEATKVASIDCNLDALIDVARLGKRLVEAIARLPRSQRDVIRLYYAETMPSMAVIGAALGLSEYRVAREKAAAIAELRRRLGAA
jgi:RNA polymerase sigma factor (sigma-70 family)